MFHNRLGVRSPSAADAPTSRVTLSKSPGRKCSKSTASVLRRAVRTAAPAPHSSTGAHAFCARMHECDVHISAVLAVSRILMCANARVDVRLRVCRWWNLQCAKNLSIIVSGCDEGVTWDLVAGNFSGLVGPVDSAHGSCNVAEVLCYFCSADLCAARAGGWSLTYCFAGREQHSHRRGQEDFCVQHPLCENGKHSTHRGPAQVRVGVAACSRYLCVCVNALSGQHAHVRARAPLSLSHARWSKHTTIGCVHKVCPCT